MDTSLDSVPNPRLLVAQLQAVVDNPSAFASNKAEIVRLARKASIAFETPFDTHHRPAISRESDCDEHHLFATLWDNGPTPMALDTLSVRTGIDLYSLETILVYLAAQDMIEGVYDNGPLFRANATTKNLHTSLNTVGRRVAGELFLSSTRGLRHAVGPYSAAASSGFQLSHNTAENVYKWLSDPTKSELREDFLNLQWHEIDYLSCWQRDRDFIHKYFRPAPTDKVLFVEVAGGYGISSLLAMENPSLTGQIILQDCPKFVETLKHRSRTRLPSRISQLVVPDLGLPSSFQPVSCRGAQVYYLRQVLTKYTMRKSIHILHSIILAMSSHSVLFLDERVVPDGHSDEHIIPIAKIRMAALAIFNDRTSGPGGIEWWRGLLEGLGFEALDVRKYSNLDNIIVCKRMEEGGRQELQR